MAHTKSAGAAKNNRESESKRLGLKKGNNEMIAAGQIIIRQRGTKYFPGLNVKRAGDDTLFALKNGKVKFRNIRRTRFDGSKRYATIVDVS